MKQEAIQTTTNLEVTPLLRIKILLITGFANLLELYDFTLFAVLLPILVQHFFPTTGAESSLLIGYLAFAVSFIIAPFGSLIWGYIGDKFGTSRIFKFSLALMAVPSLFISLLPTYQDIGYMAAVLLVLLRVLQGFSASGEVLGSKLYAFDRLGSNNYLMASCFITAFGAIGVLAATFTGQIVASHTEHMPQLWRAPFAIGSSIIICILMLRTLLGGAAPKAKKNVVGIWSVIGVIAENKSNALRAFVISGGLGVFSYFMHTFMVNFQVKYLGYALVNAYQNSKLGLIGAVASALALTILHKVLRGKLEQLLKSVFLLCAIALPLLYITLMYCDPTGTKIVFVLMGSLLGMFAGTGGVYIITSFSHEHRCRGALLVNALGVAVFGGATPLAMMWIAAMAPLAPGIILSLVMLACYLAVAIKK